MCVNQITENFKLLTMEGYWRLTAVLASLSKPLQKVNYAFKL